MNSCARSCGEWTSVGVHHWFGGHYRHRANQRRSAGLTLTGGFRSQPTSRVARWSRALPDRPRRVAAVTATDRKLWRLIAVAAPVLLLASLAYVGAGSGSWLRLVINGAVCGTYIATGLLAWSRRPANRTGRVMVAVGLLLLLDPLQDGTLPPRSWSVSWRRPCPTSCSAT